MNKIEMKYILIASTLFFLFDQLSGQELKSVSLAPAEQVDSYFGVKVRDPYRWLEDDNSERTKNWVAEENKVTYNYLSKIPFRENVKKRLTEIWNFEKRTAPFKKAGLLFYYKNNGIQNQSVLYMEDPKQIKNGVWLDPKNRAVTETVSM